MREVCVRARACTYVCVLCVNVRARTRACACVSDHGFPSDEQHSQYSKLLLASKEQVLRRVVLEERVALEQQLAEEKHTPESCFIEAAIQEVKVSTWGLQTDFP